MYGNRSGTETTPPTAAPPDHLRETARTRSRRSAGNVQRSSWLTGVVVAVLAALVALLAGSPALAAPAASESPRSVSTLPTIVLVHGAFAGASSWDEVSSALGKDGYRTVAVSLPLSGTVADIATVRAALDAVAGPKVVVGHSYGGFVISDATAGRGDVTALVYTAAFVPAAGESIIGLGAGYAPAAFLAPGHLTFDSAGRATITSTSFRDDFAQDLSPRLAATLDRAQKPTDLSILFAPSGDVAWPTIPSWYAVSGADRVIDPALQRYMAARAGATTVTFDDASHAGGFTHYSARFTKLVEQAATRP